MKIAATDWRPLLDGELAVRAEEAIRAIAAALADYDDLPASVAVAHALFYGYLARIADADAAHYAGRADQLLERAFDSVATTRMGPMLYGGFTGVAWTAEHLSRVPGAAEREPGAGDEDMGDEDMNEEVDESLLRAIAAPWTGDYDLIGGLAGFGVYALERVDRPSARQCLAAVVERLDETAEVIGDKVTWFTPPELLPPRNREKSPNGYYNLGVAHGVPGVLGVLADACRLGIRPEKARPLLDGAVRWVLSHRLSGRRGPSFPTSVFPGVEAPPSRLAWCYGDPGIAASLLYAARAAGVPEWEHAAMDIALHAATAAAEEAGVQDAGLCHGAFGLAHIYNRIYQAGGGEPFADAARLWYRQGLDMRRPGRGIAGFETWEFGPNRQLGWIPDPGFLTGVVGVGLALLAAVTTVEPEWDRLLTLAIPPAATGSVQGAYVNTHLRHA
jgi:lantibiotic modifying enzyme